MQYKEAFVRLQTIRAVDWIGVLIVCCVAMVTLHENYSRQQEITVALKSVNARTHRNHRDAIYSVAINDTHIAGSDVISKISRLGKLQTLSLSRSTLRDEQLFGLPDIRSLRSLSLYNTNVTNNALTHVGECRTLEVLTLDGTRITNHGVRCLASLKKLKYLSLAQTSVDDRCVGYLENLAELQEIDLRGTNVTNVGVERLKKLLPLCEINSDGLVLQRELYASFTSSTSKRSRSFAFAKQASIRQP